MQAPYPLSPFWKKYQNALLFPSLLDESEYKDLYGLNLEDFREFRDLYVVPALVGYNPHTGTADATTSMVLVKLHLDPSNMFLGVLFRVSNCTVSVWVNRIIVYIYQNSVFLQRSRNLSNPNHKREVITILIILNY